MDDFSDTVNSLAITGDEVAEHHSLDRRADDVRRLTNYWSRLDFLKTHFSGDGSHKLSEAFLNTAVPKFLRNDTGKLHRQMKAWVEKVQSETPNDDVISIVREVRQWLDSNTEGLDSSSKEDLSQEQRDNLDRDMATFTERILAVTGKSILKPSTWTEAESILGDHRGESRNDAARLIRVTDNTLDLVEQWKH